MLRFSITQTLAQAPGDPERVPACAHCGENHPFEMPEGILEAALSGRLVVFAGAGVSTESRVVGDSTFADQIAAELSVSREGLSFPGLMSLYQSRFGRRQLLERFRQRLDYIAGFPELWQMATRFHHALATAYFLDEIVTTNWDSYFEDVALANPIVVPEDYAFWDLPGRKVLKIHGSVRNIGTIVATEGDYRACYRRLRSGVIGSSLHHLLATKQVVFLGYSFGDSDLSRILRFLRSEMKDVLPRSYVVSPHGYRGSDIPPDRIVSTDGTYFIHKLKELAVRRGALVADRQYEVVLDVMERLEEAHEETSAIFLETHNPSVIHALAYQDGMQHAIGRIIAKLPTGHYSRPHAAHGTVRAYMYAEKGAVKKRKYWDAAYARGYAMGLLTMDTSAEQAKEFPLFLIIGAKEPLPGFAEYRNALASAAHRSATREAQGLLAHIGDDVLPHHQAYLDVGGYMRAGGWEGDLAGPFGT